MWPVYDLWGLGWWDFHTFPDTRKLPGQAQRQPTARPLRGISDVGWKFFQ